MFQVCETWSLGLRVHETQGLVVMCSGSEAGSYLRLIDSCITQIKAQEPSRTCNESKEEEEEGYETHPGGI